LDEHPPAVALHRSDALAPVGKPPREHYGYDTVTDDLRGAGKQAVAQSSVRVTVHKETVGDELGAPTTRNEGDAATKVGTSQWSRDDRKGAAAAQEDRPGITRRLPEPVLQDDEWNVKARWQAAKQGRCGP
jgi:hypothetical protein